MTMRRSGGTFANETRLASLSSLTTTVATRLAGLMQQTQTPDAPQAAALTAITDGLFSILGQLREMQADLTEQGDDLATTFSALERAHQRYHDLFELAPDAYLVTDADSRILEANQAAIRLIGYSRAYTYGRSLLSFVAADSALAVSSHLRALDEAPVDQLGEWEMRIRTRGRGQHRVVHARVRPTKDRIGANRALLWLLRRVPPGALSRPPALPEPGSRNGTVTRTPPVVDRPQPFRMPRDVTDDTHAFVARDLRDRQQPEAHEASADRRVSRREREVLGLLEQGLTNRQISEHLVLSERTVEHHISRMLARFRLSTRTHLAAYALKHDLTGVFSTEEG